MLIQVSVAVHRDVLRTMGQTELWSGTRSRGMKGFGGLKQANCRAFTLVELLTVIGLIILIAALAVPNFSAILALSSGLPRPEKTINDLGGVMRICPAS